MSDGRDVVYLYDGTFDGLLSVIFVCFEKKILPIGIYEEKNIQRSMFCEYETVETDFEKSKRVSDSVINKISYRTWENLYCVYLSDEREKGRMCLDYLIFAYKKGKSVNSCLAEDAVGNVIKTVQKVKNEAHQYIEFIRFSELEGGIYYSEIEPNAQVLPIVGRHFLKRLPTIPWIIHDINKNLCMVYNGREMYMENTGVIPKVKYSENEEEYRKLWKKFYDTIAIKERRNEKCRMTHMPKRFWRHISETENI